MDNRGLLGAKCVEAAVKGLPPLPAVVARILEETEKEDVSAIQVERILSSDQALVAKVLRIVNSSYYGLAGQVRSVSQAIVILGMQQVRNLVIGVSAMSLIEAKNPSDAEALKSMWRESFSTAIGARAIGKLKGYGEIQLELLFVGGLLANIGRLFLLAYFPELFRQVREMATFKGVPEIEVERPVLGVTHKEIGGMLAEHWKLPADLTTLIRAEEPPKDPGLREDFHAIRASSLLAASETPEEAGQVQDPSIETLGLQPTELEWLRREMEMRVRAMAEYCGLAA
ncbi:MAG: HDOD domain-containing protein [Fimbriimonadales bacterium]|nr:HDOD domain-containing protein [Fimbriimonadales bacterium]